MSDKEFYWVQQSHWDQTDMNHFIAMNPHNHLTLYKNLCSDATRQRITTTKWLYYDIDRKPLGYAEVQTQTDIYCKHILKVRKVKDQSFDNKALSLLVSSLFLTTSADLVELDTLSLDASFDCFDKKKLYTFDESWASEMEPTSSQPIAQVTLCSIDRKQWNNSQMGKEGKKSLRYLVKRYARD